jgi:fibronectin-binding autotransporter adhesin
LAVAVVAGAVGSNAIAQTTYTWNGGAGAAWNTTGSNWIGTPTNPWVSGQTNIALFNSAGATPGVFSGTTVYVGGITFSNSAVVGTSGTIVLAGATPTITTNAGVTISCGISGSPTGNVTVTGTGSVSFTGGSTYTIGTVTMTGGASVGFTGNTKLGTAPFRLSNATLLGGTFSGAAQTNPLVVVDGTTNYLSGTANTPTFTGPVTGSGVLIANGTTNNVTINLSNDFSGFTGTLQFVDTLNGNNLKIAGATAASQDLSQAKVSLSGATTGTGLKSLAIGSGTATTTKMGELSGTGGVLAGNLTGITLEVGALNTSPGPFAGVIQSTIGTLNKVGTGTLAMTGSHSLTTLNVKGGTLLLAGTSSNSTVTSVNILNGALQLGGTGTRIPSAASIVFGDTTTAGKLILGDSTNAYNFTLASLNVNAGGCSIVGGNSSVSTLTYSSTGTTTFTGRLGGPGVNENNLAFTKSGAGGVVTFNNNSNSFGGSFTVNGAAGNVYYTSIANTGQNSALGSGSTISIGGGGVRFGFIGNSDQTTNRPISIGFSYLQTLSTSNLTFNGPITLTGTQVFFSSEYLPGEDTNVLRGSITVGGQITGSAIVSTIGVTTLKLRNPANSFGGAVYVPTGMVDFDSLSNGGTSCALGTASSVRLGRGNELAGSLYYSGSTNASTHRTIEIDNSRTGLNSGPIAILANGTPGTTLTWTGALSPLATTNAATFLLGGSGAGIFSSSIAGSTPIRIGTMDTGTWTLTGNNTNTGGVLLLGGTLSVNSIGNGGSVGPLGAASSAPLNLHFSGGTLAYTGSGETTNRGLNLAGGGGAIDASGSGAIIIPATNAISQIETYSRSVDLSSGSNVFYTSDFHGIAVGQFVTGPGIPAGTYVTNVATPIFSDGGTPSATVTLTSSITTSTSGATISFNTTNDRTFALTGTSTASNTFGPTLSNPAFAKLHLLKSGPGTWVVSSTAYTGDTTGTGGNLIVNSPLRPVTGSLVVTGPGAAIQLSASANSVAASGYTVAGEFASVSVAAGGTVTLPSIDRSTNKANVLVTSDLSLAGTLNLGTSDLILKGGSASLSTVRGWLNSGALTSSGVSAAAPYTTLALFPNDIGDGSTKYFSTYDGIGVSASDLIVKYTYVGDTNLDGKLDGSDFKHVMEGYVTGQSGWAWGDVNNSGGAVDAADVGAFLTAYNYYQSHAQTSLGAGQDTGSSATAVVPEPAMLAAALPVTLLAGRRRRR